MTEYELIEMAIHAMDQAYVPYSHFHVGAALEAEDGSVITGCNIENASYGATNCAERTAFFKAISEGTCSFRRIAIVGGIDKNLEDYAAPCGICRQVMGEFCPGDFQVILARKRKDSNELEVKVMTLDQLLPERFVLVE